MTQSEYGLSGCPMIASYSDIPQLIAKLKQPQAKQVLARRK
jgi:hypothetical protein